MTFGTSTSRELAFELLDQFRELGGTFLDTANMYAHWLSTGVGGESETVLGDWLANRACRTEMVIASKVGFTYPGHCCPK